VQTSQLPIEAEREMWRFQMQSIVQRNQHTPSIAIGNWLPLVTINAVYSAANGTSYSHWSVLKLRDVRLVRRI
jgi:hypothetical protein